MSIMIIKKLSQYIIDSAQFIIMARASNYFPTLIGHQNNKYQFECVGNQSMPYIVWVDIKEIEKIRTSCDCLYDGHGICKHQVAAVNELINLLENKEIDSKVEMKAEIKDYTTYVPNNAGIVNLRELKNIRFQETKHYYSPLKFTFINKNTVEGIYNDYRDIHRISLKYSKLDSEIALKCTCNSQFPCFHKALFIERFLGDYSNEYFHEDFENRFKKRKIAEKGYPETLQFDDLFDLKISTNGIEVQDKFPNIVAIEDATTQFLQMDRKRFFIPDKTEHQSHYGVALCFERNISKITEIYPFYGKLDKTKTKLATKFRTISETNLSQTLNEINDVNKHLFITNGIQLALQFRYYNYRNHTLENIKQLINTFSKFLEQSKDPQVYLLDNRDSLVKKNLNELKIQNEKVIPVLKVTNKKPFYQLDFKIKIKSQTYGITSSKLFLLPFGIILDEVLYPILNPEVAFSILTATTKSQLNVIQTDLKQFKNDVLEPFSKVFEVDFDEIKAIKKSIKAKEKVIIEKHLYLSDEEGEYIVFHPMVKYGESLVTPQSNEKIWEDKTKLTFRERNEELENEFITSFRSLHPNFKNQSDYFYLSVDEAMESMHLMEIIDTLQKNEVRVFGLNNLKSIQYSLNKPSFSIGLSSGTDWFDMNIKISFGDQVVDLKQVQKSIIKETNFIELNDGSIGILPKQWIEKYKKYFKLGQVKKDKIEISNFQFNIIDELYEQETNTPKFLTELHNKKKRLNDLKDLKSISKPKHLEASLRPYQKEGLNWLVFLHENKLGGCLADDMGLGKTLQTIAFIQYLKNLNSNDKNVPHLVIAPTSLIFNWMSELKKFAPTLKVLDFIGPNRHDLISDLDKQDVILTTYGSVVNDIQIHQKRTYNYIILDESQAIKNPQSQRFKTVRLLKAENRLALTGTPIENNTFDLYSQFSFLNPGIFGSIKHFKSTFSEDIDQKQDEYTSDLLARMIHPFILRRTKDQVATELPAKTESVIYCEMGTEQRKVYDHFKQHFKQKLQAQIEEDGINKSQVYILQGLTKLRQICNSSALADREKDYGSESTKLDELVRHLTEKVNNHKILVFSQFVGMLQLVKQRLEDEGILFEYLDGQTKNREERVHNFQNNPAIRVFLISLKAGGTGLNLTEADYVYLIDPWWNPAVESQAIDRCYRIGQDKKVMAYRMICKDTIEEKIVQLQDKKKTVASDIIRVDTEKKSFNKKDVELFFGN